MKGERFYEIFKYAMEFLDVDWGDKDTMQVVIDGDSLMFFAESDPSVKISITIGVKNATK